MKSIEKQIQREGYWMDCDFMSGACDSYENSLKHLHYSEIAAANKDYGFGVSHLVLGAEELIKSLLLICCCGYPDMLTADEKDEVFRQHSFKHVNIKEFFTALSPDQIEDYHENPFAFFASNNNKFQTTAHFLSRGLKLGELETHEIDTFIALINDANNYKNRGFYVDYKSDWMTPKEIKESTYLKYKAVADKLTKYIEPIFTMPLTDERLQSFINGDWL